MTTISYDAIGQPMVPSGAADDHSVPISQPGASDLARMRRDREMQHWRAQEEHRRAVRKREDDVYDRRRAEANHVREAERREAAEAVAAKKRADVERDLRLDGVPEHQIKVYADRVMADWHQGRALAAADHGDRMTRELTAYFRSRPAPAVDDSAGA